MQGAGLTARELYCRRGDRPLFGGLDLTLERGEALHLTGPNGIGKSSLIQILAGLRKPSDFLAAHGEGLTRGSVEWSGSVALLDGRLALDEAVTLQQALAFWARLDRSENLTSEHAEMLGIEALMDVPVRYLSTGQRKRAGLARLLGQQADHWLLDEPLNGLDADSVATVEKLITQRRAEGGVIVVASHQAIVLPDASTLDLRDYSW
ncbi:MAG: heme ABC exporter ATP-binding protein CcmA [Erythrobacter sp.]|nr:heme ABC exporter ATP-binding protein CcmA [Erythrobacter sp.]